MRTWRVVRSRLGGGGVLEEGVVGLEVDGLEEGGGEKREMEVLEAWRV